MKPIHSRIEPTPLSDVLEPAIDSPQEHDWVFLFPPEGFAGMSWLPDLYHPHHRTQAELLVGKTPYFRVVKLLAKYDPALALAMARALLAPEQWDEETERLDRLVERFQWPTWLAHVDPGGVWTPPVEEIQLARKEHGLPPVPPELRERLEAARAAVLDRTHLRDTPDTE